YLERHLGDQAQAAVAAGQQAGKIVSRHVLHDFAAKAQVLALAGDDAGAEHKVAHRARPRAARPRQRTGHHAAHRGPTVEIGRLGRQVLALGGQKRIQVADERARPDGDDQLGGIVMHDAGVRTGVELLAFHPPAQEGLAVAAADAQAVALLQGALHLVEQAWRAVLLWNNAGHQKRSSSGWGNCPAWICMEPNSAQRFRVGIFLPGLSRVCGSKAAFRRWKNCSSSLLNWAHIWLIFSRPTPCSPVMVPPTSTQSSSILAPICSARSISPGVLASNRMSGCRLPSPAWNTLATRRP